MKQFVLLVMGVVSILSADFVEVKTGRGREYYHVNAIPKLNVCYTKRIKYYSDTGGVYLRYDGCGLYRDSCHDNGLAHFGHYPSPRAARRALDRCRTASPRFIE